MLAWFYQPLDEDQCSRLGEPSTTQFVVSCGLIAWVLLCYIPQWARIISRRSAEGISAFYILLGSLSGVCAVGNIWMLPSSIVQVGCCSSNAWFACINNLLGMFQVTFGISCFWIVLFMFYHYSEQDIDSAAHHATLIHKFRRSRQAEQVLLASNGFAFLIFIISAVILHYFPQKSQTWADVLGMGLAAGACLQWLPQIVTTWRLGHLGSLSSASLFFTAPYTWIFGISMILRVGIRGWSAWIVYVLVGTMQLVLIGFAIIFSMQPPNQQRDDDSLMDDKADLPLRPHADMSEPIPILLVDERSPLLTPDKEVP